ncbi:MAG: type IV secretion system DNA-binding domain-containing protein [Flavobacteriaceae bacterium]
MLYQDSSIKYFAKANWRNENKRFGIRSDDMQYHMAIIGKTGSGKSNLLLNLMKSDISSKRGFCLLDPHGDLIETLYNNIPESRKSDVVYVNLIDPNLEIGYNPLKKVSYEKRSLVASSILETFENLNDARSWGAKLSHILRNCLLSLLDQPQQQNFSDILRILRDKEFRKECMDHIQNEEVKTFFEHEFKQYNPKFDFVPIYNKIGGFLSHAPIKRLLVDNKDSLSLRKVMDEGKILLINVSKGTIGSDTARLIGSLFLSSFTSAGLSRIDMSSSQRPPFTLYIDEAHVYANNSSVYSMLEELRKMNVHVCLAFQHLSQLNDRLKDSLFANIGNIICFRVSAKDAQYVVHEMHQHLHPFKVENFVSLPQFHIILKMMIEGKPSKAFTATTFRHDMYG